MPNQLITLSSALVKIDPIIFIRPSPMLSMPSAIPLLSAKDKICATLHNLGQPFRGKDVPNNRARDIAESVHTVDDTLAEILNKTG